jgi:opacity protein-like surface antigen
MKKIVFTSLIATSCMFAANIEPFVGLDFVHGKMGAKENINGTAIIGGTTYTGSTSFSESLKDNTFGLKAGAIIENNHRVYLSYYKLKDSVYGEDVSYQLPAINYDYLIIHDKLKGFIPYVGAHIGYGKTEYALGLSDESSMDYGLNVGVMKNITDNISLELAYKYTFVNEESSVSGAYTSGADSFTGTYKQELEEVQAITFGINYKF